MNDSSNVVLFTLLIVLFVFVLVEFAFGNYHCATLLLVTIIGVVLYAGREPR